MLHTTITPDIRGALQSARWVAILRGDYTGRWLEIGEAILKGGVTALEVTLNSPGALEAIQQLRDSFGSRALVGAGTVVTPAHAKAAIDHGAMFLVAPDTDEAVIQAAGTTPFIPGAYTATEIKRAWNLGAAMIKVFPGPSVEYLKALRGPFPDYPLMITGGVTVDNAADYLRAGAQALGIGSYLADPRLTTDQIAERATKLSAVIASLSTR